MTDAERTGLREAKAAVSRQLAGERTERYRLESVDPRLREYVDGVCRAPGAHNLFEQLAVARFLRLCCRYGLNALAVRRFFTLYESLWFPGASGPCRYRLTPVQAFQFASIFGFWDGGRRVVREALLFVPRKFSKTTGTAALAVQDLLYGEANAECYTAANSSDQAKKCFDVIRQCLLRLDPAGRRYTINEQTIKSRRADRTALAQCLTANARTKDGLNASTVIMDEYSQARDSGLLTVLTTSMGTRRNPLTVIITTASDVLEGPFFEMLRGYKRMLLGQAADDDGVFAHIFEPDVDDDEGDERTWRKVHPHIGVTVSMDFYRAEWAAAQRGGSAALMAFRTKLLNVFATDERRAWISARLARSIAEPMPAESLAVYGEAMIAIDLSESEDLSAVSMMVYDAGRDIYRVRTDYFFARGALAGHPDEAMLRAWAAAGWLHLTEGDVIDYTAITDHVLGIADRQEVLGIGYDPWKSLDVVNRLSAAGASGVLHGIRQTYGYFTAPVQSFEHGAKTGRIVIDDNPINFYCFGNAVLDYDTMGNCKPVKRSAGHKIDGVITMLMCLRQFIDLRE